MPKYPYTIEDFAEAYEATKCGSMTVIPLMWDFKANRMACGCPQGVLAFHRAKAKPPEEALSDEYGDKLAEWTIGVLGISDDQYNGFAAGFDISEFDEYRADSDAYLLGRECRKRFMPDMRTDEPPSTEDRPPCASS